MKLSLFAGNMILYVENPRFYQNTVRTNEEFNKVTGYKINIQNSIVSPYTNNDWKEKLRNNCFLMYKSIKMNKLPRNKYNQGGERLVSDNYKTLIKEIGEGMNKSKDIAFSWIRRINIVKMSTIPKTMYRFNAISMKIPGAFFAELDQTILNFF